MTFPSPTRPAEVLRYLEQQARRRFGQHFLADTTVVARIVRAARVKPEDRVIEIGPGLGILTDALTSTGATVTAVELDRDLASWIRAAFPSVRLVEADATKVDWAEVCPEPPYKMVANLPYNVGTGLVADLADRNDLFTSLTVMLQKEVVARLTASPDTKAYNALTVRIAARAQASVQVIVPPGAFHPPPKVDSAVARLDLYPEPDFGAAGREVFDQVVNAAFARRRKTIRNSLTTAYEKDRIEAALQAVGIEPRLRAEVLPLQAFRDLAAAIAAG